jgi:hypothetical protein
MKKKEKVSGEFRPSRLMILLKGGERKFIPDCCLSCKRLNGVGCEKGLRLPISKGSCTRWETRSI